MEAYKLNRITVIDVNNVIVGNASYRSSTLILGNEKCKECAFCHSSVVSGIVSGRDVCYLVKCTPEVRGDGLDVIFIRKRAYVRGVKS